MSQSPRKMSRGPAPVTYRPAERASYAAPTTPTLFYRTTQTRGLRGASDGARGLEAWYLIGGGLVGAATLLLSHLGYRQAATAIGVAGALTGATIGVVKLLSAPASA